jgi:hypothetical protein
MHFDSFIHSFRKLQPIGSLIRLGYRNAVKKIQNHVPKRESINKTTEQISSY